MPLLAIGAGSALLSAGTGAYQMFKGNEQEEKGKDILKNLSAPVYNIPKEVKENLTMAEQKALEGLPSEMKKEFVQNMDRKRQESLNASAERKGGLIGIQQSAQEATDAFTNLTSLDAQARAENEQRLTVARNQMAAEKEKVFNVKEGRYQQGLASGQAMVGAGEQNFMGGLDQIAGSILQGGAMVAGGLGNKQGVIDDSIIPTTTTGNTLKTNLNDSFRKGLTK